MKTTTSIDPQAARELARRFGEAAKRSRFEDDEASWGEAHVARRDDDDEPVPTYRHDED